MYRSNTDTAFVPTKIVSIKPESQVDYTPQVNQIRFNIPQFLGFIDPCKLSLKYNLTFSGRGYHRPDGKAGCHSLMRDIRIQDGSGRAELEMLQDVNVQTASWWDYTQNPSITHRRELFEGKSSNSSLENNLFWSSPADWTTGTEVSESPTAKNVQIQQPIYSGILGPNAKVFPLLATQGLRVQMTLDTFARSSVPTTQNGTGSLPFENKTAILGATGSSDSAKLIKSTIDEQFSVVIRNFADRSYADSGFVNRNASPENNNPLFIGDILYVAQSNNSDQKELGVVVGFTKDVDGDLEVKFIPNRAIGGSGLGVDYPAGSGIYYKPADRTVSQTYSQIGTQFGGTYPEASWTISDLEMIVAQVQPPQGYVERMMKQISSSTGLSMDFTTSTLYRVNLSTKDGLTNQFIPANQTRAFSILSVPLLQGSASNVSESSLQGIVDGAKNYQYVYGGSLIPDRPVELQRLDQSPPRSEALHLIELEKALSNADYGVRDLTNPHDKFLVGRALSRYGQVFDLQPHDLSLRVEYQNATDLKLFEHFVSHLRRITISSQGVSVSM